MKRILILLMYIFNGFDFNFFSKIRIRILRSLGSKIGSNVKIKSGFIIDFPENLIIGNNVSIQQNCLFSAYEKIVIGNDVSIAHGVSIITSTHPYMGDGIIRENPLVGGKVVIGNNCWIGMKSSILYNVEIGDGVVVAGHSMVNKSCDDNILIAGVPARYIKSRR